MIFEKRGGTLVNVTAETNSPTKSSGQMTTNLAVCQSCPRGYLRGVVNNDTAVRCASMSELGGCDGCGAAGDVLVSLQYNRCPLGYWE